MKQEATADFIGNNNSARVADGHAHVEVYTFNDLTMHPVKASGDDVGGSLVPGVVVAKVEIIQPAIIARDKGVQLGMESGETIDRKSSLFKGKLIMERIANVIVVAVYWLIGKLHDVVVGSSNVILNAQAKVLTYLSQYLHPRVNSNMNSNAQWQVIRDQLNHNVLAANIFSSKSSGEFSQYAPFASEISASDNLITQPYSRSSCISTRNAAASLQLVVEQKKFVSTNVTSGTLNTIKTVINAITKWWWRPIAIKSTANFNTLAQTEVLLPVFKPKFNVQIP